jgi:hypothetical protein
MYMSAEGREDDVIGERVLHEAVDDPRTTPFCRTIARYRWGLFIAWRFGRWDEGIGQIKRAIDDGYGRPDDACMSISNLLLPVKRRAEAIEWAKRAIDEAKNRVDRSKRGPEALAEGRPEFPLDQTTPGDTPTCGARLRLLSLYVIEDRFEDGEKVVDEFRRVDEERDHWQLLEGFLRWGQGKTDEGERLIDDDIRAHKGERDLRDIALDFAGILRGNGKEDLGKRLFDKLLKWEVR